MSTSAVGDCSHAGGSGTLASGNWTFSFGENSIARENNLSVEEVCAILKEYKEIIYQIQSSKLYELSFNNLEIPLPCS